ncbi:DnaB-like helicase C-terminal domain-containing protein, partial [Clostridium sp.]|uniref:DnaB-like helicase C-terminal domain-containing protein n=1 Tax=Clostridium sp. TaxID=1506 RepID=UPI002FC7DCA9
DIKKKQIQEDWLDNTSLEGISDAIDEKIEAIKLAYVDNASGESTQAGEGAKSLIERLKLAPEVGVPMFGPLVNTITRGARLKKFYLRSSATGMGKTRSMVADACNIGCNEIYDATLGWIKNGTAEPTLLVTTEQELEEIQTMMLAFLSNVNEDAILNGTYAEGEEERVIKAAEILENSPLYVEELPDFSLRDIENTIKKNVRDKDVKYVFFDYIHTSLKILEEITKRTGGVKLREDNILFMISIRLKDLCNEFGIFIMSATQLNGNYQDASLEESNQNLLRGAKSIADKIDLGCLLLPVTENDLESLKDVLSSGLFDKPSIKMTIYKNRRGKFKSVVLWCRADLGTCRIYPMFLTDNFYGMVEIENTKIIVKKENEENWG